MTKEQEQVFTKEMIRVLQKTVDEGNKCPSVQKHFEDVLAIWKG